MTELDPGKTAVLVCDFQALIVGRLGAAATPLLERTAALIAAARTATVPVIYVVVGFRPGYPEVAADHPVFGWVARSGQMVITTAGADIAPEVAPRPEDPIVVKRRVGAFQNTDLEVLLRARKIDTLVMAGISTSGVILSTIRYGADVDYRFVVASDCCADPDDEVHRVLMGKVFPRQATVVASTEIVAAFG